MKSSVKLIIAAVLFVAVIAIAIIGYDALREKIIPDDGENETVGETNEGETKSPAAVKQTNDFTVINSNGESVNLSDSFGKPIVVNFWATWCGPCKSELPDFESAYKEYGDDVVFMMVNLTDGSRDTVSKVKTFVTNNGFTFPVFYDTKNNASIAYSIYSIPMTLFINADGTLESSQIGMISESKLKSGINKILENGGKAE